MGGINTYETTLKQHLQATTDILQAIQLKVPFHEVMDLILLHACRLSGSAHGSLQRIDWEQRTLHFVCVSGPDWTPALTRRVMLIDTGITGKAARTGKPVRCEDISDDPDYLKLFDHVKSALAVPVMIENKVWGVICIDGLKPCAFSETHEHHLKLYAQLAASTLALRMSLDREESMRSIAVRTDKLASVGKLVAGFAHEMNNPLTSMIAATSLLKAEEENPDRLEMIELIESEGQRATGLVQDLLGYARVSKVRVEETLIDSLIEEAFALVRLENTGSSIELIFQGEKNLRVRADRSRLKQVLLNLFSNSLYAIKASERPNGCIVITTKQMDHTVQIRIQDNGTGMNEATRNNIFESFFTTKSKGEGTGLGLAIVKEIVEAFGATISCESTPGLGASFTIEFPRDSMSVANPQVTGSEKISLPETPYDPATRV